jgi:hypothetical protein
MLYINQSHEYTACHPVLLAECDIPLLLAGYHRIDVGSSPSVIATAIRLPS